MTALAIFSRTFSAAEFFTVQQEIHSFIHSCFGKHPCSMWTESWEMQDRKVVQDTYNCPEITRKPSYRWQTHATRKPAKNCSNSTCLQRCRWQYWPIFVRLAAVASEICEIPRNSQKIQTYEIQGHSRSSILVPIESPLVINSNFSRICYRFRDIHG